MSKKALPCRHLRTESTESEMLQNTFVHLPGIGLKTELSLWQKGIHSWDFFSDEHGMEAERLSAEKRYEALRGRLEVCRERLCACDPAYFAGHLTPKLLWRLFADFGNAPPTSI